ncbi:MULTISPECIES: ISAzo13-like element transposase-related protein [Streptomyces]|uniref:Uncharacterized protein n=1 Tax=Streptomyces caviscabies TaxID=90079 RepID=A0ABW2MAC0_9ACTN
MLPFDQGDRESVRRWWNSQGRGAYPHSRRLLITADKKQDELRRRASPAPDRSRVRLWRDAPLPADL